jgi:hypothetical protein
MDDRLAFYAGFIIVDGIYGVFQDMGYFLCVVYPKPHEGKNAEIGI